MTILAAFIWSQTALGLPLPQPLQLCEKPAKQYVLAHAGTAFGLKSFKKKSLRFGVDPVFQGDTPDRIEARFDYYMNGLAEPCENAEVELAFRLSKEKACTITSHKIISTGDCRQEP